MAEWWEVHMRIGRDWVGLGFQFVTHEAAEGIAEAFKPGSTVRVVHCLVLREVTT